MATSSQQHCFVCGLSNVASESQPRRRYAELTTIFKTLVMTGSFRDTIPADYLATNVETCAVCLTTIKEVFALRQEIVALQTELDGLLVTARKKLTSNPRIGRSYFRGCIYVNIYKFTSYKQIFEDLQFGKISV